MNLPNAIHNFMRQIRRWALVLERTRVVRCGKYWKCGVVEGELVLEVVNDGSGALLELRGGVGGLCTGA